MFNYERLTQANLAIKEAIFDLGENGPPELIAQALKVRHAISINQIRLSPRPKDLSVPTITSFAVQALEGVHTVRALPMIVYDADKILSSLSIEIMGDLVRTISLASSFPDKGYHERYRTSLEHALNDQADWLDHRQLPLIHYDPRSNDYDKLFDVLIPEEFQLADTGWRDFVYIAGQYVPRINDGDKLARIATMNKSKYVQLRQAIQTQVARSLARETRQDFADIDPDRRAEMIAAGLVAVYVYKVSLS